MNECNPVECNLIESNSIEVTNTYFSLSDQTKFRLNEITEIKDYFNAENQERKTMSEKLSKYIAAFNYINEALMVLSAKNGGISIISLASAIDVPVGIASAIFSLIFFLTIVIIKKLLKITRNKNKKYNKIVMLANAN